MSLDILERLTGAGSVLPAQYLSFTDFCERELRPDGADFTFEGRAPLVHPAGEIDKVLLLQELDRTVTILKGTQIGATTIAVGLALYCAAVLRLNVGYFLPDQDFADRFDDTRIRPAIRNENLKRAMRDGAFKGVSPKGLKEFPGPDGSRYLYILGLRNIGNAISMPMDVLIRDEIDDIPPKNLKWSNDRVDASPLGFTFNLAMGRLPGAGVHAMFLEGNQQVIHAECEACGETFIAEEHWPKILCDDNADPFLSCPNCGMEVDREGGVFKALNSTPARGHSSYRISQLSVTAVRLSRIAKKWADAHLPSDKAGFRCSALAMPDAGDMQPITDAVLQRCRSVEPYAMEEVPA